MCCNKKGKQKLENQYYKGLVTHLRPFIVDYSLSKFGLKNV